MQSPSRTVVNLFLIVYDFFQEQIKACLFADVVVVS